MSALRRSLPIAALVLLVLVSAFAVIASTHEARALYAQLQILEGQRWYLEEEHSRLLLEQGTWSSHHRVASEARQALGLEAPDHAHTRLVTP